MPTDAASDDTGECLSGLEESGAIRCGVGEKDAVPLLSGIFAVGGGTSPVLPLLGASNPFLGPKLLLDPVSDLFRGLGIPPYF